MYQNFTHMLSIQMKTQLWKIYHSSCWLGECWFIC